MSAGKPLRKISLAYTIRMAELEHGSLRAAARALGVDAGYLFRLKSGKKSNPSEALLTKLHLKRVTILQRVKP